MICEKCGRDKFPEWQTGKTYEGIDEHHNPPQFLMKNWKGDLLKLCRKCHTGKDGLHYQILILMNKKANTMIFLKSEDWLLKKMCPKDINELAIEVYEFTNEWLKRDGNGDDK